jgi:HEPN domain-containing protein
VEKLNENPPYTHQLVQLADKISTEMNEEQLEHLETITDSNLEARYPDEKFSFKRKCTREFTETYLHKIEEIRRWLLQKIQP